MEETKKYTILAVDDVPLNLILVEKMLTRQNFIVKKASGGQQALDMIAKQQPSLVLLDLMMPNVDGFEVLSHIRENKETENLPVVILSALNSEHDIKRAMKLGANDFVTKPIIMDRLVTAIKKALETA